MFLCCISRAVTGSRRQTVSIVFVFHRIGFQMVSTSVRCAHGRFGWPLMSFKFQSTDLDCLYFLLFEKHENAQKCRVGQEECLFLYRPIGYLQRRGCPVCVCVFLCAPFSTFSTVERAQISSDKIACFFSSPLLSFSSLSLFRLR